MVTTTIFSKNNDVFRKRRYGEEGEKQPLHKIPRRKKQTPKMTFVFIMRPFSRSFFLRIFPHSRLCVLWTVTGATTAYLPGTYSPVLAS